MQQQPSKPQPAAPVSGQTPGTDHIRSEDSNLPVIPGAWASMCCSVSRVPRQRCAA